MYYCGGGGEKQQPGQRKTRVNTQYSYYKTREQHHKEHQAPCKLSAFSPPNNNSVTAAWFFN